MPAEDRLALDSFFRLLVFRSTFGYVLYGDKPMSMVSYVGSYSSRFRDYGGVRYSHLSVANSILRDGWRVWKKYCHLFPAKNYYIHEFNRENSKFVSLLIINKTAFGNAIANHRSELIQRFGSQINAEKIFEQCLSSESLYGADLEDDHYLLGILFGYGRHNAQLFQKREELEKLSGQRPLGLGTFEEIEKINLTLRPFAEESSSRLLLMALPSFTADPAHAETIALKKKYKMQRKRIGERYQSGNFLELTLLKLME